MKLILRGKRFGFSLEEIRELLDLYGADAQGLTQLKKTCDAATLRLAEMKIQQAELAEAITDLESQLAWGRTRLKDLAGEVATVPQAAE